MRTSRNGTLLLRKSTMKTKTVSIHHTEWHEAKEGWTRNNLKVVDVQPAAHDSFLKVKLEIGPNPWKV